MFLGVSRECAGIPLVDVNVLKRRAFREGRKFGSDQAGAKLPESMTAFGRCDHAPE